jgi:hypothetical protein
MLRRENQQKVTLFFKIAQIPPAFSHYLESFCNFGCRFQPGNRLVGTPLAAVIIFAVMGVQKPKTILGTLFWAVF